MTDRVTRFDRGTYEKPKKLPNGHLRVDAAVTRAGVFKYVKADGSVRLELRHPDEVFKEDSLDTLSMVPVTDDHPPVFLTDENTTQYARGHIGERIDVSDGRLVKTRAVLTSKDLIDRVSRGDKREASCGYRCRLDETPGVWNGEKYDAIQRDIVYNHVAIVKHGRAGPEAGIRLDDANSAVMVFDEGPSPGSPPPPKEFPVIKRRIDGVEFDVSEGAAQALEKTDKAHADAIAKADADLAAAKKSADEFRAKADALAEDKKKLEAELQAAPEKIRADIAARVQLETLAEKILGKDYKFDGKSDREVREAVVLKTDAAAKLKDESDDYVRARFDMAIVQPTKPTDKVRAALTNNGRGDSAPRRSLGEVLAATHERLRNDWKPKDQSA